ncbi:putative late blight resistance protein homolog R1A-10 [Olea europaea var. sylvestris]|uniref:putative late blight resistance protein homolog R1A-10 n=1 Tax=Olea europaea var. sylvestris TaxID=158386 RepID=UPI000C1CDB23|nr:putative late blight resistance protein homolog R1A-10 [Olea europaea var. sylvestris]
MDSPDCVTVERGVPVNGLDLDKWIVGLGLASFASAQDWACLYKAEKTRANWEYVAENVKSAVTGNYDDFMEILSWSYNHLPHRLRACFLYMGIFPENYAIHVSHLIRLWVAEGILKPNTHKSLEEVAKEYLEELIDRSLIMVRGQIYTGEIKTCSIHDTMRELCMRKAQEEKFLYVANHEFDISSEVVKNQLPLSIHRKMWYDRSDIHDSTIRSILYFTDNILLPNFLYFQLPRVLEAGNIHFSQFPIEIVELVNLRFIALSYTGIFKIPASIYKFCNLQTLIVYRKSEGDNKILLPEELLKMPRLRHLLFDEALLHFSHGPQNANLQTLSGAIDFRFTQEALQIIPNLKKLGISYYCGSQIELSFYCLENIVYLQQLESFKCNFRTHVPLPHNMSLAGSLPNLEVLKLKGVIFESTSWKTKEGEFSLLKFLLVERNTLKFWEAKAAHFPSLQRLCLRYCRRLKYIPPGIGEIPTLQLLILYECSSSVVTSATSIRVKQQDLENDDLEVHAYSFLMDIKPPIASSTVSKQGFSCGEKEDSEIDVSCEQGYSGLDSIGIAKKEETCFEMENREWETGDLEIEASFDKNILDWEA